MKIRLFLLLGTTIVQSAAAVLAGVIGVWSGFQFTDPLVGLVIAATVKLVIVATVPVLLLGTVAYPGQSRLTQC